MEMKMAIPAALLAAQAIAAGVGVAQGVAGARKTPLEKANEERLARLAELERQNLRGLDPAQKTLREQQLLGGARAEAARVRRQNEARMAGSGGMSGADLSRLRQEEMRALGSISQAAATQIGLEDLQKKQEQEAEERQLEWAVQQGRDRRRQSVFGAVGQAATAAGALAGGVPEVQRIAGVAGAPVRDARQLQRAMSRRGVPESAQRRVFAIGPENITRVLNNLHLGRIGPDELLLQEAIHEAGLAQGLGLDRVLTGAPGTQA